MPEFRRIEKHHPLIGHYHTAGNPGRAEMDESQEINYPPILKAILATGYQGFVAQEFIPTWKDPVRSLRHGAMVTVQWSWRSPSSPNRPFYTEKELKVPERCLFKELGVRYT